MPKVTEVVKTRIPPNPETQYLTAFPPKVCWRWLLRFLVHTVCEPSGNSISYFPVAPTPPNFRQPSRESRHHLESACTFLIHKARGSAETGVLPGEPPHAVGRAPGRKLAGVQGVSSGCETLGPFPLGTGGSWGSCL